MSRSQSICAAASCRLITNRIAEASSNRRASRRFEKHSQRIANAIGGITALPKDRPADSQVKKEKEKMCHYSHKKELSRFSVTKFLAEASNQVWEGADGELTGLEREASDALKSDFADTPPSLAIPCFNSAIVASCSSTLWCARCYISYE
jgi:hypothetical protein